MLLLKVPFFFYSKTYWESISLLYRGSSILLCYVMQEKNPLIEVCNERVIIKLNENISLAIVFKIICRLLDNSTWLPYAIYKFKVGNKGEILRKQTISLYNFKKFDLDDFIEFIFEGMSTQNLESGNYFIQEIDGLEIRSKLSLPTSEIKILEGDLGLIFQTVHNDKYA